MNQTGRIAVMGTGTEIGKTYVSCSLLVQARRSGLSVCALKPVLSGYAPGKLADCDAGMLSAACGEVLDEGNFFRYCRYAFQEALAPNLAARRAGVPLAFEAIVDWMEKSLEEKRDLCLVEGAGGVMSPLTDQQFNIDLAVQSRFPVVLVTASYLGAVTHTLTALEACERRGVTVAALAISRPCEDYGEPADLAEELARWSDIPSVCFPFQEEGSSQEIRGAQVLLEILKRDFLAGQGLA